MQQHTGQHILSQSFVELADAETVSFHLGVERVTIDLSRADLDAEAVLRVEGRANGIVQENREILTHWTTKADVGRFPLRKPPKVDGSIRVVEIREFDYSACGGTHVSRTGEIGLIKILRRENYKGGLRVEFVCGLRALADYGWKHDLVRSTAERFSVLDRDLGAAVERLELENRDIRRRLKDLEEEALAAEAERLAARAVGGVGFRIVRAARPADDPESLKRLAGYLREKPGLVVLLGAVAAGGRAHMVFARSDDVSVDVAAVLRSVLPVVDGKGGGRPEMAQGSGPAASRLAEALEAAEKALGDSTQGLA
jgi:alanyl-tRNA synthetase